jgi:hypothetical protein
MLEQPGKTTDISKSLPTILLSYEVQCAPQHPNNRIAAQYIDPDQKRKQSSDGTCTKDRMNPKAQPRKLLPQQFCEIPAHLPPAASRSNVRFGSSNGRQN